LILLATFFPEKKGKIFRSEFLFGSNVNNLNVEKPAIYKLYFGLFSRLPTYGDTAGFFSNWVYSAISGYSTFFSGKHFVEIRVKIR
jgi:hypothetical protein